MRLAGAPVPVAQAQWAVPALQAGEPQQVGKGAKMELPAGPRVLRVVTLPEAAK